MPPARPTLVTLLVAFHRFLRNGRIRKLLIAYTAQQIQNNKTNGIVPPAGGLFAWQSPEAVLFRERVPSIVCENGLLLVTQTGGLFPGTVEFRAKALFFM